jgi:hypothetical protein
MASVYFHEVMRALSQLVNALLFAGRADEPVSVRFGRNHREGGWTSRVWWPDWWIYHTYSAVRRHENRQ